MRKLITTLSLLFVAVFSFAQGNKGVDSKDVISIKNLVDNQFKGTFSVRGMYISTHSYRDLIFLVEEDDYIIPIKLVKNDLGAEKRFRALNLQPGDTLVVKGILSSIYVEADSYKGLEHAAIIDIHRGPALDAASSQSDQGGKPFKLVEQKPSFMGGDCNEFSKWVNSRLQYPEEAKKNRIQGRVTVSFTIKADGTVSDVHVLQGVEPSLDAEAVRVISGSPKWVPGRSEGEPVDVTCTFPVYFMLR